MPQGLDVGHNATPRYKEKEDFSWQFPEKKAGHGEGVAMGD